MIEVCRRDDNQDNKKTKCKKKQNFCFAVELVLLPPHPPHSIIHKSYCYSRSDTSTPLRTMAQIINNASWKCTNGVYVAKDDLLLQEEKWDRAIVESCWRHIPLSMPDGSCLNTPIVDKILLTQGIDVDAFFTEIGSMFFPIGQGQKIPFLLGDFHATEDEEVEDNGSGLKVITSMIKSVLPLPLMCIERNGEPTFSLQNILQSRSWFFPDYTKNDFYASRLYDRVKPGTRAIPIKSRKPIEWNPLSIPGFVIATKLDYADAAYFSVFSFLQKDVVDDEDITLERPDFIRKCVRSYLKSQHLLRGAEA